MSDIPIFKATEWRRDKGRGWTASVLCDRERDRDEPGLIGKVEIDGELFECVGVERFMPRRPIAKGEAIWLLVREIMPSDRLEAIFKVLLTADDGCESCAWNMCDRMGDEFPEWKAELDALWQRRAEFKPYVMDVVYGKDENE